MKPLMLGAGHLWVLMSPWRTHKWPQSLISNPQFNIWNISYITSQNNFRPHFLPVTSVVICW